MREFDDYVDKRHAEGDTTEVHIMFGEWIASLSGNAIIGGPVGEPPEFVALPEEEIRRGDWKKQA